MGAVPESDAGSRARGLEPLTGLPLDEHLARSLIEESPDGLLIADGDGVIRLVNKGLEEMFGYERAELLGQPLEVLVPDDAHSRHRAHRLRYRAAPHRRPMGQDMELEGRRRDGRTFPVEISLSPLLVDDDVLTIATIRDVTVRREAEEEVNWVQRLLDATNDAVYVFDRRSLELRYVNEGACRQTGYERAELDAMSPLHLLPELPEPRLREALAALDEGAEVVEIATSLRRVDGSDIPVDAVVQRADAAGDRGPVYVAVVRDVSDRLAAQREIMDAHQRLALVEDRERIARDLHDMVIQRLFATGLSLQASAARVTDEHLAIRLRQATEDLDDAIREIRMSIFSLHATSGVAAAGLRSGVLAHTTEASRLLGFAPTVRFVGPVDSVSTPDLLEHALATLREALSNVARHAAATQVDVEVRAAEHLSVTVVDDGRGLAEGQVGAGSGLRNLHERAEGLGGELLLEPHLPRGTRLVWTVPLG